MPFVYPNSAPVLPVARTGYKPGPRPLRTLQGFVYPSAVPVLPAARVAYQPGSGLRTLAGCESCSRRTLAGCGSCARRRPQRMPRRLQGLNLFSPAKDFFNFGTSSPSASSSSSSGSSSSSSPDSGLTPDFAAGFNYSNPAAGGNLFSSIDTALQKIKAAMPAGNSATYVASPSLPVATTPAQTPPASNPTASANSFSAWWKKPSPIYSSWTNGDLVLGAGGLAAVVLAVTSMKRGRR